MDRATEGAEMRRVHELMRKGTIDRDPHGATLTVFVFGSNRAGIHGLGAAATAHDKYGAVWGVGEGLMARSYALPTKDERLHTLKLDQIHQHVTHFRILARLAHDFTFVVTRVGCGLAGLKDEDVAPMFKGASKNCLLPIGWRKMNNEPEDR